MKKLTKGILTGLCAAVGFSACAAVCTLPTTVDVETAYAETTYTTVDNAFMAYIDDCYAPGGNFYLIVTMSQLDTTTAAEGVAYNTATDDMPTMFNNFDFFNKIKVNGYTLKELGCTSVWENAFDVNAGSGAPLYKLRFHMHADPTTWQAAINEGKVTFGVGSNVTVCEGALIPGYAYLQGDKTATVYRAGCDFVTESSDVAYGVMSYGKTEVESIEYVTGWDENYNNAYLGVSLKGDDYLGDGTVVERHPDYYSAVYTTNQFPNKILVDGEAGKTESYGLFNHGNNAQGYYSFVIRAAEADSESITIPAGTLFPSRAMRTLFDPNGNPVYIMYETQTDVTFYKQADGTWKKPYEDKETDVASVKVAGSDADNFTVISLSNHDYLETLDNYGGTAVSTIDILAGGNFYTHVLIDGVELGSTNEAFVNVWGNKGSFAIRTNNGTLTSEVTILAGCQFPSYAELSTGERVRFVTTKDITFVKNAEGEFVEASEDFATYAENMKAELDAYLAGAFRPAEEEQRLAIIAEAKAEIDTVSEKTLVSAIVAEAKTEINKLKTASQYESEELQEVRDTAIAELEAYRKDEIYFDEQTEERRQAIDIARGELAADTSEEEIAATVELYKGILDNILTKAQVIENAKAELDAYKADEGYFKETEAAQRAAIVEEAKTTIDNATTQTAVNAAVTDAKAAIDALTTAAEYYTTQDVAMAARVGGWYGNGNFTLKITLGNADWTNETAGVKEYNGDLTKLLTKLDFFNHVKLGEKTLAEWGCTACYDNNYELNEGEPDYIFLFHLAMGKENMDVATAAGLKADMPATVLEGALVPSYAYLTQQTGSVVYRAGCDYVTTESTKPYGIESVAKTTVESVKYVQGHDGTCGYFGISFVGDDYLGDGTQLEVDQNYNYDNKFSENLVLVNGETGKVGYYGLFNLGEKGTGYYAFQMNVPEEEIVSITIPAGARFPTRAMTTLRSVNGGNPVFIMYEVEETVVLYKTENGYVSYADLAIAEVENYKAGMFREAEEAERSAIVEQTVATIRSAADNVAIDAAVTEAKAAIDELKTAGQYADEENAALVEAKNNAISEIEAYKADEDYFEEQTAQRAAIIESAKNIIKDLTNEADITATVADAKADVDELATKANIVAEAKAELDGYKAEDGYFREEQAAERASIVAEAKTTIDNATTQTAVNEAVAQAKTAIDALMTAAEYYTTQEVAMAVRVGGWYGNGNFTLKITLGNADWTNADEGEKAYDGDLANLLTKLGFFDHVKLGDKTLAQWGCTACYDNNYELNTGEPDNIFLFHLAMGKENMDMATAAGIKADMPATVLEGALIPSYGYMTHTSEVVYRAGCDYVTTESTKPYGIESVAKVMLEDVKYVQGHDGTCGYFGVSFVGDDYLGDGTQLEINQDYYFDNKFSDVVLVNGETGKVGYYGLFNLGENGAGYYAFQMNVPEEEIVSITIPAGTRFPTRAMTTLKEVNGHPVYIMYEVESEITLYKSENGFGAYAEYAAKVLSDYKAGMFREAEETERLAIVAQAKADMQGLDNAAIDAIMTEAKLAIDGLKTDAQYAEEEFAVVKQAAISEMEGYKVDVAYLEEQTQARANLILAGKEKVTAAAVGEDLTAIVDETKAEIDALATKTEIVSSALAEVENYKAGMFREAEEAERVAIVAQAKADIEAATAQSTINTVIVKAKTDIDGLKTAGQYADEENAALLEAKNNAIVEIEGYKADEDYFEEEAAQRTAIIESAKNIIKDLTEEAEVTAVVADAKADIDAIVTKAAIIDAAKAEVEAYRADETSEEQEAERAVIVEEAKTALDNATTQTAVNEAVANAKTAIDKLLMVVEGYKEVDIAFIARIGDYYNNGNFILQITLGQADWTEKMTNVEYSGDMQTLFEKLGFFDYVKVGEKTLRELGCVAFYDNTYDLDASEPDRMITLHLAMGADNLNAAIENHGFSKTAPVTIMEGALIPSYGYLTQTGNVVYRAGCDYVTVASTKAYGIEAAAKVEIESVKYVQGHDGTCGYFGISFVGDDYLGDGSQLEINQNYYYDYKFSDLVLVNGESGKVGYYGLFNLGEKGVGYYAFQIFATEEELVSITIPAGARFPARAMTDLYTVNGNPVYIMYEVATEITLYKMENGFVSYAEYAAEELADYKAGMFREAEEAERLAIVAHAQANMQGLDNAAIDAMVASAKLAIDALKTAAQYADEELADDKQAAISEMEGYKADVAYLEEQVQARANVILAGKEKVAAAVTLEDLAAIVDQAKAEIDGLATKEEIVSAALVEVESYKADLEYLDEQAAEKAAVVEVAKTAIENAATQATIQETVANAKAAIDEIKTKAEIEAEALAAKKDEANAKVDALKKAIDFDLYEEDAITTINGLYATVKAAIENAETEEEIEAAVAEFEAALAEVPQEDNGGDSSESTSSDTNSDKEKPGKKGCSSVASGLACSMMALAVVAAVIFKKKEN